MLRVKDPKRSIQYYEFLGLKVLNKVERPESKSDLYFLGYDGAKAASSGNHWTDRQGVVGLLHNHGTENDDSFKVENGNSDPYKGFGHICVSVDNIQAACKRLEDAGYKFQKKLKDGRMKTIAFALDPDNYWVEIIALNPPDKTEDVKDTEPETYRMNHTMIRVKDIEKSLSFYKDIMGMTLRRTVEMKEAEFNLYFLSYGEPPSEESSKGVNPGANQEGLLELTYNYGSEKDPKVKYHNGDDGDKGFGHIGITVDNLEAAAKRFEEKGVTWKSKLSENDNILAFMRDPDGYVIELCQNESMKKAAGS